MKPFHFLMKLGGCLVNPLGTLLFKGNWSVATSRRASRCRDENTISSRRRDRIATDLSNLEEILKNISSI